MKKRDLYKDCPEFQTKSFLLRLIKKEDASDLLNCYSDKDAVSRMNDDKCSGGFYITRKEDMENCIHFWLEEYKNRGFIRLSIIPLNDANKGHAIGTIEIFGGDYGVLRIDLATEYEKPEYVEELIKVTIDHMFGLLSIGTLVIKSSNVPGRMPAFLKIGMVESSFRDGGYMEWKRPLIFNKELGFGVCGLACCLCTSNKTCLGCRKDGCPERNWCKAYHCWIEKGLDSCSACPEDNCDFMIINKPKVVAFNRFLKDHGKEKLLECLERNEKQGINYHYIGEYSGDYDADTVEEAYDLILHGWEL